MTDLAVGVVGAVEDRALDAGVMALPSPPASIHFMGLGGIGVSGLARILLERGYRVSGCDLAPSRLTDALAARGAAVYAGHDPSHLDGVDLLVVSSAVRPENPELAAAVERGLPIVKRAALLGRLLRGLRTIAVAGTHGKTTTSALVVALLLDAGLDPTAFIGGEVPALDGNARGGHGAWAVAEADEYDRSFLRLAPAVAVITNIEADHFDIYRDLAEVEEAFAAFVALLPADGTIVACADDARVRDVVAHASCRVVRYGLDAPADWTARDVVFDSAGTRFTLHAPGAGAIPVVTRLSGRHNVANVLGALAAAAQAGVAPAAAIETLARFAMPRRRQEIKGHARGGALVIDDYAHHPTEIRATLAGLRARYPDARLRVAFQPHTYGRTRALLAEIAGSFGDADEVAIAEVYAARQEASRDEGARVGGREVAAAASRVGARATFTATLDDAAAWLGRDDGPDVALVTMGAGDIWKAGERICT